MKTFYKMLILFLGLFFIFLLLNVIDVNNLPIAGDWTLIKNEVIGMFSYLMFIFMGFYFLLARR